MTNATKALVITAVNSLIALPALFGVGLDAVQQSGIAVAVNAVLALVVGLTYKNSAKRVADA